MRAESDIGSNLDFCVNTINNLNKKYEKFFNQHVIVIIDSLTELKKITNKSTTEFKNALQRIYHQVLLLENYKKSSSELMKRTNELEQKLNNIEKKIDSLLYSIIEIHKKPQIDNSNKSQIEHKTKIEVENPLFKDISEINNSDMIDNNKIIEKTEITGISKSL